MGLNASGSSGEKRLVFYAIIEYHWGVYSENIYSIVRFAGLGDCFYQIKFLVKIILK